MSKPVGVDRSNSTIQIDRSKLFDPKTFIGGWWSIVEQDERSVAITTIDLDNVALDSVLDGHEISTTTEKSIKRLKERNCVRLDAGVFITLWQNQSLIPEKWKERINGNTTFIYFDGTVLRNYSNHYFYTLYLYWDGDDWCWGYRWLESGRGSNRLSAIIKDKTLIIETSVY